VKNEIIQHHPMIKIHALEEQIKFIENWKLALAEIIRESPLIELLQTKNETISMTNQLLMKLNNWNISLLLQKMSDICVSRS
jgi:hypothetical protein